LQSFHGTSSANATRLAASGVNVRIGGGELGRGFYTGEHLHNAKAWAFHMSGDKRQNVVEFVTPDVEMDLLDIRLLDYGSAALYRQNLRKNGTTRTFEFNADLVWAPLVGSERVSGDQYKWESDVSQALLNGSQTLRAVI
jgi:hypothetical protein